MNVFQAPQTIVIKIGSSLVIDRDTGTLREDWLQSLVEDIAAFRKVGHRCVIVSSGAVALGRKALGLPLTKKLKLEEKQAAAACGQVALVQAYQQRFAAFETSVAQILLTIEDSEMRRRYLNATSTLQTLLQAGVVPVINENDSVATGELRVGDNDRLAARVAQMVAAESLILFSDIDGLYTSNPATYASAKHIPVVETVDARIEAMAGGVGASGVGSGGMATKIAAAKMAAAAGCQTIITLGLSQHPLQQLQSGGRHTLFRAPQSPESARKQWIGHGLHVMGALTVDAGAVRALQAGNSLLPAGVTQVSGAFERGDAVAILSPEGQTIGRGLVAFTHAEAQRIAGKKSTEVAVILEYEGRTEIIHRDNLVIF